MSSTHLTNGLPPDLIAEAIRWRHHLHRHAELAHNEYWTADFIAAQLSRSGLTVHSGVAGTGVVGTLTRGTGRRVIAIHAEMNALPIQEESGVSYISRIPGVMHACGHDGHIAMLLAAARHLSHANDLDGTVHFIFQSTEEGHESAKQVIEDDLVSQFPCEAVYALHNWPDLSIGTVAMQPGPIGVTSDKFEITLEGAGGHASLPHLAPDAISAACHLVSQINTVISRRIPPAESALVSVTRIHGGRTHDVLPPSVTIAGSVKSSGAGVQDWMEAALRQIANGVAQASGTKAKILYDRDCSAAINDPETVRFVQTVAGAPPVNLRVVNVAPSLAAGDSYFMPREIRGCNLWLGSAKSNENPGLHSPRYDFNDGAIPLGIALWVSLVRRSLQPM